MSKMVASDYYQCECSDPGCPHCSGDHQYSADASASMRLFRIDMEDETGTYFCDGCGSDALDSGVFRGEED
jgi:hypothetical protein